MVSKRSRHEYRPGYNSSGTTPYIIEYSVTPGARLEHFALRGTCMDEIIERLFSRQIDFNLGQTVRHFRMAKTFTIASSRCGEELKTLVLRDAGFYDALDSRVYNFPVETIDEEELVAVAVRK